MNNNVSKTTNFLVKSAVLSAIAVIFMYFEFPILPAFPFLKIDLSDVPALIGGFALGPAAGLIIEAFKNVLIIIIRGSESGGVGNLANFIIGASFVYPAALIYHRRRTFKSALVSMLVAIVSMAFFGVLANYFILIPLYMKNMPTDKLINYVISGIIPFNMIKGAIISVSTLAIYKKVSPVIQKENLISSKKLA
ncbi:Riboflavin transporter FmnP [Clostridium amylolyticum]|uniref:Riboflavin transporter n=1 Tax=Clostridium amylolyticum TaxID=1121298 RepID=A0A1M6BBL3_9CLOT|nr:ECF transporter S component [Clostridium amylolyticum]SHI46076.1 Riboflavin transporter FmnP [Clostridium amylolyticum]